MNNAIFVSCKSIEEYKKKMKPILKFFADSDKVWSIKDDVYLYHIGAANENELVDYITAIYNTALKRKDRLLKSKGIYYYINNNKIIGWDFGDTEAKGKINIINLPIMEELE